MPGTWQRRAIVKFLLGGLVAGLVLNVSGICLVYFFLQDAAAVLERHFGGFPAWAALAHVAMRFAVGIALLWVLTATHSRVDDLGLAIGIAVLTCWVLAYPGVLEVWIGLGALRGSSIALAAIWGFVELGVAAFAGWHIASRP